MGSRHAPATRRNRDPITAVLRDVLPARGIVLEIASGSGEHVVHFAALFPDLVWQPSDPDAVARGSVTAWTRESGLANLQPVLAIDAAAEAWPVTAADAILCINMIHISPWEATMGLMANSAKLLPGGAPLILYGPYFRDDTPTAPSNAAFNLDLQTRCPDWGLRCLEDVDAAAMAQGLEPAQLIEMPANNIMRIYRKHA